MGRAKSGLTKNKNPHQQKSSESSGAFPRNVQEIQDGFVKALCSAQVNSQEAQNFYQKIKNQKGFEIYFNAYRARLRSAVEADFSVSVGLMVDFEKMIEKFSSEFPSETFTLNEIGRFWLEFLGRLNQKKMISDELLQLAEFEYELVCCHFASENPDEPEHMFILDEDAGQAISLPSSTILLSFDFDVVEAYLNHSLPQAKLVHVVIFSDSKAQSCEKIKMMKISEDHAQLLSLMENTETLDELIEELENLNWSESKAAKEIQSLLGLGFIA